MSGIPGNRNAFIASYLVATALYSSVAYFINLESNYLLALTISSIIIVIFWVPFLASRLLHIGYSIWWFLLVLIFNPVTVPASWLQIATGTTPINENLVFIGVDLIAIMILLFLVISNTHQNSPNQSLNSDAQKARAR